MDLSFDPSARWVVGPKSVGEELSPHPRPLHPAQSSTEMQVALLFCNAPPGSLTLSFEGIRPLQRQAVRLALSLALMLPLMTGKTWNLR